MTVAVITLAVLLVIALGLALQAGLAAASWRDGCEEYEQECRQLRQQRDDARRLIEAYERIDAITAWTLEAIRRIR